MTYNFDQIINRENTNCYKYDLRKKLFGTNNLIPLWVADMDFKIADEIISDVTRAAEHGIFGYTFHYDSVFESIIEWQKAKHNWHIPQEAIHFYHGVVPSINVIIQEFTQPGDGIIVQNPVYFPFFQSIELNNRRVIWNELVESNGQYKMDFASLEASIDKNTKMLILCHPHNPVGRVWTYDELMQLHDICKKHNILVISDEIHADILLQGKHIPWASLSEYAAQESFTLTAPSKTFNIAGLNLSVIICLNKQYNSIIQSFIKRNQLHGINLLGFVAFESAYRNGHVWLDELLTYLKGNIALIQKTFENTPITFMSPQATYLAWLNCTSLGVSDAALRSTFIQAGVGLSDGTMFGKGGEGYMRLNFACPREILEEALHRITRAVLV
jgi:cysteine-S-conjugate beta-lyase